MVLSDRADGAVEVDVPEIHAHAVNVSSSQEITRRGERYASRNGRCSESINQAPRWDVERPNNRV